MPVLIPLLPSVLFGLRVGLGHPESSSGHFHVQSGFRTIDRHLLFPSHPREDTLTPAHTLCRMGSSVGLGASRTPASKQCHKGSKDAGLSDSKIAGSAKEKTCQISLLKMPR